MPEPHVCPSISGLRLIAIAEAAKGMLVLLAGFGLLSLLHRDVQSIAEDLVRHLHLNPASRYPRIFIEAAHDISDSSLLLLAGLAFGYAVIRLIEAYGLWQARRWAEWLAVTSGSVYVPIEVYELFAGVSWIKVFTLAVNVGIVAYMSYTLWRSSHGRLRM